MGNGIGGRTGTADLPLHGGKAPKWLFRRMSALAEGILEVMVTEYDRDTVLQRVADPYWFQALTCVLGFDWHSSGTTTVTCHALKEAMERTDLGLKMAGGKGKHSLQTPIEVVDIADSYGLPSATGDHMALSSRLVAKVDNALVQDGHALYHHSMILSEDGEWAVVQQGMDSKSGYARRYHWNSHTPGTFIEEPHNGICGTKTPLALDLTSTGSGDTRDCVLDIVGDGVEHVKNDMQRLDSLLKEAISQKKGGSGTYQSTFDTWTSGERTQDRIDDAISKLGPDEKALRMPRKIDWGLMKQLYDVQPTDFEDLISVKGVGPATVRALSLVSELIHGTESSWQDPVRYSFTVGGKDGVPYPVDRRTFDKTIEVVRQGIDEAKVGKREKFDAFERLSRAAIIPAGRSSCA